VVLLLAHGSLSAQLSSVLSTTDAKKLLQYFKVCLKSD